MTSLLNAIRPPVVLLTLFASNLSSATQHPPIRHDLAAEIQFASDRTLGPSLLVGLQWRVKADEEKGLFAELGVQLEPLTNGIRAYELRAGHRGWPIPDLTGQVQLLSLLFPSSQRALNSLVPSIVFEKTWIRAEVGFAFRFYNADASTWPIAVIWPSNGFAPTLDYEVAFRLSPVPDRYRIELTLGNRDEFLAGNLASLRIFANQRVWFTRSTWLELRLGLMPTGGGSFTANAGSLFAGLRAGTSL